MSNKRKVLLGSASNVTRMLLSALVSFVLPPFLVRRMPAAEYGAWVLILQLSAYVNYLDFGLQAAIGKFIAGHDAAGDREAARGILSTSFLLLCLAALAGAALVAVLVWQVPRLFHGMPSGLLAATRGGLLAVGLSVAVALPFNAFFAVFSGLQKYGFPTVLTSVNRGLSAAALIALVTMNGTLLQLALVLAAFNVAVAIGQLAGWYRYARDRAGFAFRAFRRKTAARLAGYGGSLSLWTLACLLISGLDLVLVGHYDYGNTGYYAIASSATNFLVAVVGSIFGPLIPAISALEATHTPEQLGRLAIRVSRYCALALCALCLPLLVGGYPLLALWAGRGYALRSAAFLEILVLANAIRMLAYPYAMFVVATGRQRLATLSSAVEAALNFGISLWLVQTIGAAGAAIGTLAGALAGVAIHLTVSMPATRRTIAIRRSRMLIEGFGRPLLCTLPTILLYPFWQRLRMIPANPVCLAAWAAATLALAWSVGLDPGERQYVRGAWARLHLRRLERAPGEVNG